MALPPILPAPRSIRSGRGRPVRLGDPLRISADDALASEARWLRRTLETATGWQADLVRPDEKAEIVLALVPTGFGTSGERKATGAYRLAVGDGRVSVTASDASGAFWGAQTLRQLLPVTTFRAAPPGGTHPPVVLEPLVVDDAPRFGWRGVHLDVARHFMPKTFLLKLVDLAALHKLDVLHLHLTDDQGWRVPIDRYPLLTEIGAWRRRSPAGHKREHRFDDEPHGGFYTREDLREVAAYSAARHIEVLPEVDMPGHMLAAIAAYPELGNGTKRREVGTTWGISPHVLRLDDDTLRFCAEVIDEVCDLFPGSYFHVGGDECPTTEWRRSPDAVALMEREGLVHPRQLQGWFTARITRHLARGGRRLVGWDEILEGGAPRDAVVMSWRGMKGGIDAACRGHDVVMAPEEWLYFDWASSDDPSEPLAIRGATPVERVYAFDPLPEEVPEDRRRHVLGAQCQLWTEYVKTPDRAEYQYFPRLCAFAETVWSELPAPPARDHVEFDARLAHHLGRLDALGVNYRPLGGPTPGQARTWRRPGPRLATPRP